ncbi:hypothetical protein CRUP_025419 [Coryphaenoides rupestris]|nr:hypothetical protein CRUP_025419 [Coryphaenoides rupestris]
MTLLAVNKGCLLQALGLQLQVMHLGQKAGILQVTGMTLACKSTQLLGQLWPAACTCWSSREPGGSDCMESESRTPSDRTGASLLAELCSELEPQDVGAGVLFPRTVCGSVLWKGLYPLHIAAGLSGPEGPRITEVLLHSITDPDAQAQDKDDVYPLDKTRTEPQTVLGNKTPAPTSWGSNSEHNSASKEAPAGGGRTALHVACQRDNDYSDHAIARTVYCKLSQLEKETYKAREAADSKAAELANSREHRARRPLRSCYQCGRSAFVTLTPCSRCHRVLYCSNRCKLQAWEHRHRDECIRVPASTSSSQQNKRLKSSRMPRPLVVAEKVAEGHISCSENYSFI